MSLYGLPIKEIAKLAKQFADAKDTLGLNNEEAAAIIGVPLSEINYLETFKDVEVNDEGDQSTDTGCEENHQG